MALETGSFIDDLVTTNPESDDPLAEIDDHFQLIKGVLKASLPGLDRPLLDSSGNVLSSNLPAGMGVEQASVAEILAGTNDTKYMTPKDLPHHRGACVAWADVWGTQDPPIFRRQWNFSTVTRNNSNQFTLTLDIEMASIYSLALVTVVSGIGTADTFSSTTSFTVDTYSRYLADMNLQRLDERYLSFNVAVFGDLA